MGARQVLRVALIAGAIGAIGGAARAAPARPPAIQRDEPVIVMDARAPATPDRDATRARFGDALDRAKGVHVERGGEQDAALAGIGGDDAADAAAALDEARAAYGALDCAKARPAAERAATIFAARQAAGLATIDGNAPRQAWAYVLLCADHDGDHGGAAIAAAMLRTIGVKDATEANVGADTWAKYPDVDARTASLAELTVEAEASADVWIDLAPAGKAPVTATLAAGDHVIAAAAGTRRAAQRVTVQWSTKLTLALEERSAGSWGDVIAQVRAWQRTTPAPPEVTALVRSLHVRFAFVLADRDRVVLWALGPDDQAARVIESGTLDDAAALGALVAGRVAAWDAHAPAGELLVEDHAGGAVKKDHWWVYASLIGAIVLGGVVVYAHDSAQDTQHIELRYP
jgi:hypothetical protein